MEGVSVSEKWATTLNLLGSAPSAGGPKVIGCCLVLHASVVSKIAHSYAKWQRTSSTNLFFSILPNCPLY